MPLFDIFTSACKGAFKLNREIYPGVISHSPREIFVPIFSISVSHLLTYLLKKVLRKLHIVVALQACRKHSIKDMSESVKSCFTKKSLLQCTSLHHHHYHHYVPSVVNRSAVMDLHRSRSCATLIQSLYDIFVHSLMLSVHIVLGLPRPLLPFILPSISNRCTPFPLIICPKY